MTNKLFTQIFLISIVILLLGALSLNVIVDPYDVTGKNLLKIKHKLTRDGRQQKIARIKELKSIENLILGSSRSERLNPDTVTRLIGGYTYSFGIGGANIEDALGLLLYLEKEKKLPKNIILCIDFSAFRNDLATAEGFYKIPEINFLDTKKRAINYQAKLFSIDAIRASIKTFKIHLKNIEPDSFINENGYLQSKNPDSSGDMEEIKKVADEYYSIAYKEGKIEFSETRFNYLRQIVSMSKKHDMQLYVMLTPVHIHLYRQIENNTLLFQKLAYVKNKLLTITPYYDAMVVNKETSTDQNFADAVHYTEQMGDKLLYQLLIAKHQQTILQE